ncbi:MAG TPA: hypothetical protein PKZ97_10590 [Azospirillaceae bacterium]|nr:hypothetical protein [Azospirillaceae bacterium]HRQ81556.1 hypothetical protein [Azospirillaceae bacterium]
MTKTVILGDEYDDALRARVFVILRRLGAETAGGDWALGGSQEVETVRVRLGGADLTVEAETYVGLSLTGPDDAVDRVTAALAVD